MYCCVINTILSQNATGARIWIDNNTTDKYKPLIISGSRKEIKNAELLIKEWLEEEKRKRFADGVNYLPTTDNANRTSTTNNYSEVTKQPSKPLGHQAVRYNDIHHNNRSDIYLFTEIVRHNWPANIVHTRRT